MPIRVENRALYPADWKAISRAIRDRAGNVCEQCGAINRQPHPVTGSFVVLTVAHLDHDPRNCQPDNLKAWCQRCHNSYDGPMRAAGRKARRAAALQVPQ
jgi:5-methylcytosine-specific restriction endonuclease McrA